MSVRRGRPYLKLLREQKRGRPYLRVIREWKETEAIS
jgi:hypothetical protein